MLDQLPPLPDEAIDRVREWIDDAERVTVLTGAGISTDSGIPDYRGPKGVWTRNPKAEKMSNIRSYLSDPEVRQLAWRNRVDSPVWAAEPNTGHDALVQLQRRGKLHALLTQNVDGLHQAAGTDPELVVEVHGTMHHVECWDCGERSPMGPTLDRVRAGEDDPPCLVCGGILKSATISFGQNLVASDLERAEQAAIDADVLLTVGSTLAVAPINAVVPVAKRHGARVVIVNGSPTDMDELADELLLASISDLLPRLVRPRRNT
ncbi:MAG: Sir2 family NAD-dependent protein deacetylase [Actinomycetota bacterium]